MHVSADPTFSPHRVAEDLGPRCGADVDAALVFETELLTQEENLVGLMVVNRKVLAQDEMPTRRPDRARHGFQ